VAAAGGGGPSPHTASPGLGPRQGVGPRLASRLSGELASSVGGATPPLPPSGSGSPHGPAGSGGPHTKASPELVAAGTVPRRRRSAGPPPVVAPPNNPLVAARAAAAAARGSALLAAIRAR